MVIAPEETCFCLFSAPTEMAVEALNELVSVPTLRVVTALLARPDSSGYGLAVTAQPLAPH
jgi:hypothetical protein